MNPERSKYVGPAVVAVACTVPLVLWAAAPLDHRFAGTFSTLNSIGVLVGLAGVSAYAVNLVLGSRLWFVAVGFGGPDRMYRAHRIIGRIAWLLLVAHAGFIFAARSSLSWSAAWDLFTPDAGWTIGLGVIALAAMTIAIALTLYVRLNHEVFVYVQRAFGFIFLIGVLHVFRTPGAKSFSAPLTYYLAALCLLGAGAFTYRSLLGNVLVPRRDYVVTRIEHLDESIVAITMAPRGKPITFMPGQFVFVTFASKALRQELVFVSTEASGKSEVVTLRPGAVRTQFHPFSITSAPGEPDLRVVVKASGDYTDALRVLEEGALARVEGPYGAFSYLLADSKRQAWIAGGVGVTPFLSMARHLDDPDYEIDFVYCTKRAEEAHFLDELGALAAGRPNLRVIPYPEDRFGFLTAAEIAARCGGLEGREFFLCGPPAMVTALRAQLIDRGVPRRRIHFEEFGFAGKKRL